MSACGPTQPGSAQSGSAQPCVAQAITGHALSRHEAAQLSPLVLAYMGDTVYDLFVRTMLISESDATARGLHAQAARRVCAAAQAVSAERVYPLLDEREQGIYRRGRNAHMGSIPKNASIADYRAATALEAVLGYLYLCGEDERVREIMQIALREEPAAE